MELTTSAFDFAQAWQTNHGEEGRQPLRVVGRSVQVDLRPFGISTARLR